jgi:hypothetical protein
MTCARTIDSSNDHVLADFHWILLAEFAGSPGHVASLTSGLPWNVGRVERVVNGTEFLDELLDKSHGLDINIGFTLLHGQIDL